MLLLILKSDLNYWYFAVMIESNFYMLCLKSKIPNTFIIALIASIIVINEKLNLLCELIMFQQMFLI